METESTKMSGRIAVNGLSGEIALILCKTAITKK
jgi:hypothetical protein